MTLTKFQKRSGGEVTVDYPPRHHELMDQVRVVHRPGTGVVPCRLAARNWTCANLKRGGAVGNSQWMLDSDIGLHQDDWNPYQDLPDSWNLGDCPSHESELEVK